MSDNTNSCEMSLPEHSI